jgi:AcrR family transcriptional regulator
VTTSAAPAVPEPTPGLRERKKIQLREQLKAAALRRFAERGYDEVTVDDIATAAEVSPRTFYRYFASKEQVLVDQWETETQTVLETLRARPPEEPAARALQEAFLFKASLEGDDMVYYDWLRTLHSAPPFESIQIRGGAFVTVMVADRMGLPADDLRPAVVVAATIAAVREANLDWVLSGGRKSLFELTRQAFAALPEPRPSTALAKGPPTRCQGAGPAACI